ncbi:MAG: DUF177 domain-containing protein [Bacteroidota bacterium]|nr:DUF177 domain-containing protein [Bacteroidota bacterium]
MKINISNLSEGIHEYEVFQSAENLRLPGNFTGDVAARVTLEKTPRQIVLRANVSAHALFLCDRCADEFCRDVNSAFTTVYGWGNNGSEKSDEYYLLASEMNMIDISEDVKEYTLLAVPLKLLCRENCAGLCPRCGGNLNAMPHGRCTCPPEEGDSRWNALEKLRKAAR